MNPEQPENPANGASLPVVRAVRELETPEPDPAFRARLRHDFVSGRIASRVPAPRPWFARPWAWLPVAATAVAVIVSMANRGPDWQVVSADGVGRVVVNGASFNAGDAPAIGRALARGGEVRTEGAVTLDLVARGHLALAIAPDARAVVPPAPNRWWARHAELRLESGDLYVSTGRAFHGATFDVQTPTAIARCVGTSFAVLSVPVGTCVCVMEGQVHVAARNQAPGAGEPVPEGMRRVVDHSGHGETSAILEDSVHHLHRQLSRVGERLDRGATK